MSPPPPDHGLFIPPGHPRQWTPLRQRAFLRALSVTGDVARAARTAGMSRQSAYRLRARLAGRGFDQAWTLALRLAWNGSGVSSAMAQATQGDAG
ncbi:MAG TPA: LysR family transcriptional regulator [Novosphingobium sp.]|nr:LysR family transcriptional regulator [Novosphingobium sp.]